WRAPNYWRRCGTPATYAAILYGGYGITTAQSAGSPWHSAGARRRRRCHLPLAGLLGRDSAHARRQQHWLDATDTSPLSALVVPANAWLSSILGRSIGIRSHSHRHRNHPSPHRRGNKGAAHLLGFTRQRGMTYQEQEQSTGECSKEA